MFRVVFALLCAGWTATFGAANAGAGYRDVQPFPCVADTLTWT